jgi:general secretion pathway protein A
MYRSYYSLQREPFHITPDPEFLFLNESHQEALGSLIYGIEKRKGFIAITGGIGLGKTTIVRSYLESKDDSRLKIIYVFNANVTFTELLKTILQELNIDNDDHDIFRMVNRLHFALIKEYEAGNNVVIIIDEAQNMPTETLENLRMLSNLETSTDKLVQMVFVGQQEFDVLLNKQELRQLKQRIAIRTSIQPLSRRESHEYINHRLKLAGLRDGPVFTLAAMERIVREAKGVPRTINILCDNALITGFGYEQKPVGLKTVNEVISDFRGERLSWIKRPYLTSAGVVISLGAIVLFFSSYGNNIVQWTNKRLLGIAEKQETAVRIPIKAETSSTTSSSQTPEKTHSDAAPEEPIRPTAQTSTEKDATTAIQTDSQLQTKPNVERTRYKRRRSVSPNSDDPSSREPKDHKSPAETRAMKSPEDPNLSAKSTDISRDVDDRLLQMIRQSGPDGNRASEDRIQQ